MNDILTITLVMLSAFVTTSGIGYVINRWDSKRHRREIIDRFESYLMAIQLQAEARREGMERVIEEQE